MLNHIRASGNTSVIHGYLIQSPCFQTSDTTTKFWQIQAIILAQLCLIRSLSFIVAVIHPDHDGRSVKSFQSTMKSSGWIIVSIDVFYPDLGNTVAGSCRVITAVHSSSASTVDPLLLKRPSPVSPRPLGEFLWEAFNWPEQAISLTRNDADFGKQGNPLTASSPALTQDNSTSIIIKYFLHHPNSDISILVGSEVISADGLCPAFNACPNSNIFQHHFGIEFYHEGCSYIRAILPFEFAPCFGFIDQLMYRLSQAPCKFCLDSAMPAHTSAWLFKQVHAYLVYLQDANTELFLPNQFAAPTATIQAFVNGAIGTRLPSQD
jgi:hypothetical protein